MALKSRKADQDPKPARFSGFRPLDDGPLNTYMAVRHQAAHSPDAACRSYCLSMLGDLDSFVSIIDSTPYDDTRQQARVKLYSRMSDFTDLVLGTFSVSSDSSMIRAAASEILADRAIRQG